MKRFCKFAGLCGIALALAALVGAGVDAKPKAARAAAAKPNVDLVICLDTSNSMDGLIESAKTKLWDIVNELAKAKPAPELRIALFAYGSPKYGKASGYVRKELDFTTDLDMVYQKLFALRTNGGDEYVARVSQAALDQLQWSKDKKALRLIFVCGNEAATQDRQIKIETVAGAAVKRGIIINTIYCRWRQSTDAEISGWKKLAQLAEGRYISINQHRGAVAMKTPVDIKLAVLGAKLNKTYLWYGKGGRARQANQKAQDANAAKQGRGVAAARTASKATNFYRMADADLVDRLLAEPKFDITKVPEKQLPEKLQKMKPAERLQYVKDQKAKRLALKKEIAELNKQRQEFIRNHQKKHQTEANRAFDEAVRTTLRIQAKKKGIQIPE